MGSGGLLRYRQVSIGHLPTSSIAPTLARLPCPIPQRERNMNPNLVQNPGY